MTMNFSPSLDFARQLDSQDALASYRGQFVISDPDLIQPDQKLTFKDDYSKSEIDDAQQTAKDTPAK